MPRSDVVTVAELLGRNPGSTPHVPLGPGNIPRQVRREPWLTRTNKTSAAITFGSVLAVGTTLAVGSTLIPHGHPADETTTPATTGPVSDSSSITPHSAVPEQVTPAPSGLAGPSEPSGPATLPGLSAPGPTSGASVSGRSVSGRSVSGRSSSGDSLTRDPDGGSSAARVPAQDHSATRVPSQGRHAASTPRGPHVDSQGSPKLGAGSSGAGRHRENGRPPASLGPQTSEPSNPDRRGPDQLSPDQRGSDHHGQDHHRPDHPGSGPARSGSDRSGGGLLGGVLDGLSIGPL